MSDLSCSVVIPSHNRRDLLARMLTALAAQTVSPTSFEVIVVLDGSNDDSGELLKHWSREGTLPNLRWHEQPRGGQASARNAGLALARSPIVVFLDDDVIPEPDLLAAHLSHHRAGERLAVLGDCVVVRERPQSLYELGTWAWWEDTFQRRTAIGEPQSFRDFCAGNVSLRREDFQRVGGFDPAFKGYGGEDYELGYRLLRDGVRFSADRRARAHHHHRATVARVLRATRQEAHGDVLFARKHPEVATSLRLIYAYDASRRVAHLALRMPWAGDVFSWLQQRILPLHQAVKRRRRWQSRFEILRSYAYWRGVRDALGSLKALHALQREALPPLEGTLDLSADLSMQLARIPIDSTRRLVVVFGDERWGVVELPPGLQIPLLSQVTREIGEHYGTSLLARIGEPLTDAEA